MSAQHRPVGTRRRISSTWRRRAGASRRRVHHRRRRRILRQRAHARSRKPEGSRLARRRTAHPDRPAHGFVLSPPISPGRHRAPGAIGHRTGRDHHRRSARRAAGRRRARHPRQAICELYSRRRRGAGHGVQDRAGADAPRKRRWLSDPRISNSEGASVRQLRRPSRLRQFARISPASTAPALLAEHRRRWRRDGESMERDYWYTLPRGVPTAWRMRPEHVGRMAAQRALRRLNAVKVDDAEGAGGLRAAHGALACWTTSSKPSTAMSIYRQESFLAGKLGEKVAADNLTVIDDGTHPGCSAPRRSTTRACLRGAPW